MVGLVFTFEAAAAQAFAAISHALRAACLDEHIAFETLRETCGEAAQVAVLFSDLRQLDGFTMRLTTALPPEIAITGLEALCNDRAVTARRAAP